MKKKFATELEVFRKIRNLKDGLTFVECNINLDLYESDHKPSFLIHLVLFNWTIIEFQVYNIYHHDYEEK